MQFALPTAYQPVFVVVTSNTRSYKHTHTHTPIDKERENTNCHWKVCSPIEHKAEYTYIHTHSATVQILYTAREKQIRTAETDRHTYTTREVSKAKEKKCRYFQLQNKNGVYIYDLNSVFFFIIGTHLNFSIFTWKPH